MVYRLAADAMMTAHFMYIVFVVVGGFVALRLRWMPWLHVPAVAWAVYVQFAGRFCPLTVWEQRLRGLAGEAGYQGGFIDHYLMPVIYPADMTVGTHLVLGAAVIVINAVAYGWLIVRR